ncbi:MAG: hypothetical protein DRP71_10405 [Verrucomicrobia bacterium]|nr:MAG: hypothetical protein DRP71_10405 [Verrucomicrobiota bacterium]
MGVLDFNFDLAEGKTLEPDPARVREIAAMLPDEVTYFGFPGSRRDMWDPIGQTRGSRHILDRARVSFDEDPRPVVSDALYLSCLEQNSPAGMNAVVPRLCDRLVLLPMAECIDPAVGYLQLIVEDIRRMAELSSWIHPNNDGKRDTFDGRTTFNDLTSTFYACILATGDYLLADRLDLGLRSLIRSEIDRRLFRPFEDRITSGRDIYWWVKVTHNWNSFCLANFVCCALLLKESKQERAWYIALAEDLIKYSEEGFPESGFYTEGISYWGGGFGHYLFLSEMIRTVTGGRIDWLKKPIAEKMSRFGARAEIQKGVYPAFGDSPCDFRPPPWLVHWMNNRIDSERGSRHMDDRIDSFEQVRNVRYLMLLFHQVDPEAAYAGPPIDGMREWFEDVQYLICRPGKDSAGRIAATISGVHNGVNHSHNDVGAFTVIVDEVELITDPGKEVYSARTFSRERYESGLLNSSGHSVPVVAGQLQVWGKDAFANILETSFSDDLDRLIMDLGPAYRVEGLLKLTREFKVYRSGAGRVEVVDWFEFAKPSVFETALITYGDWELNSDRCLTISRNGRSIRVAVSADTGELVFRSEIIQESSNPNRLAWRFRVPVREARIRMVVSPS